MTTTRLFQGSPHVVVEASSALHFSAGASASALDSDLIFRVRWRLLVQWVKTSSGVPVIGPFLGELAFSPGARDIGMPFFFVQPCHVFVSYMRRIYYKRGVNK